MYSMETQIAKEFTFLVIELTDIITRLKNPVRLRLVKYRDEGQDIDFVFLTNAFHLTSLEIAEL